MIRLISLLLLFCAIAGCVSSPKDGDEIIGVGGGHLSLHKRTGTFPSLDGIAITADLYNTNDTSRWIVLCHQMRSSRGEYEEIAPRLCAMGYACLAIDQRSGEEMNGVKNETVGRALGRGKEVRHIDAAQDIRAAIRYAISKSKKSVLVMGSSYSAGLALVIAKDEPGVGGVIAFSPGEYFGERYSIASEASGLRVPVFATSAKDEARNTAHIVGGISDSLVTQYIPTEQGDHGARALWSECPSSEGYWRALRSWLARY